MKEPYAAASAADFVDDTLHYEYLPFADTEQVEAVACGSSTADVTTSQPRDPSPEAAAVHNSSKGKISSKYV